MQTADKYFKFIKENPKLFEDSHDIFMPRKLVDNVLSNLSFNNRSILVLFNIEFVISLLYTYNVPATSITFYADHANKIKIAKNLRVNVASTPKPVNMKFDYVVLNPPFGKFKEFKSLSESLAKERALIISGSRDYHNNEKAFENVEYYKYLGDCFPTAKIVASLAIVNPAGAKTFTVEDEQGVQHTVSRNHPIPPGKNVQDYIWALNVLNLKLPGYTKFQTGSLYRKDAIFDANGVKVAFTMGRAGADFDQDNYGNSYNEIQKQKTAWSTVSISQQKQLGGYGYHAIGISYMANETGHLGNVKYLPPDMGCGEKSYWHPVLDQKDAQEAIRYLNHPDVIRLVSVLKSSVSSNSKETFSLIPHHSQAKKWIPNYV